MMTRPANASVFPDLEALSRHAAAWLVGRAEAAPGRFAVALSGGSTPRRFYELLSSPDFADRMPWPRVHWFWGDERFVPPGDARSNLRLARETFLSRAPVPEENIHPVPTTGVSPEQSARLYEATLRAFYGGGELDPQRPLLDVNLLGLGDNGHTASLFPGTEVLGERLRWVAPVFENVPETRITLTYPALESSRHTVFLVAGESKQPALSRVWSGDVELPASHLHPMGELLWFVDEAAVGD